MLKRLTLPLGVMPVVCLLALLLAGCGGPPGQLSYTLAANGGTDPSALQAGQSAQFAATIVNNGPGSATGVTVHLNLPAGLRYKSTDEIDDATTIRTQPLDAQQSTASPVWGVWNFTAPIKNADGTYKKSTLTIIFTASVAGDPGDYQISGEAIGNSSEGKTSAKPLPITIKPAPLLSFGLAASPTSIHPLGTTTYTATVTNSGSGAASGVAVFITLPPVFQYTKTDSIGGNAVENNLIQPVPDTLEAFYSGFEIPPAAQSGPGKLTIQFTVTCVRGSITGTFSASGHLTDASGDFVKIDQVAPVQVT